MAVNFPVPQSGAVKLQLSLTASSTISKLDVIKLDSNTHCSRADFSSYANATSIGIALNQAVAGNKVDILLFGVLDDPGLNFPLNDLLFLSSSSTITNIATSVSGQFHVEVGKSLGAGSMFVSFTTPQEII